jgi:hypothetical protein
MPINLPQGKRDTTEDWEKAWKELQEAFSETDKPKSKECQHAWKQYIGFNEQYDYCTICDKKRE